MRDVADVSIAAHHVNRFGPERFQVVSRSLCAERRIDVLALLHVACVCEVDEGILEILEERRLLDRLRERSPITVWKSASHPGTERNV